MASFGNLYAVREMRSHGPLDHDQLRKLAPSIFATTPWCQMSDRYGFIPTSDIVTGLRSEGFLPVAARQGRSRIPGKGNFTRHEVRFRMPDGPTELITAGAVPEIILRNGHDGTACYEIELGLFRVACFNGLIVKSAGIDAAKVKHNARAAEAVVDATYRVVKQAPRIAGLIEDMRATDLAPHEQAALARAGLEIRYGEDAPAIEHVSLDALNMARRIEDRGPDAWRTMNRIQESLLRGGAPVRNPDRLARRSSMRAVNSITEDARINRGLWILTEALLAHKRAA